MKTMQSQDALKNLSEIKNIMERSSKFLSLSGLAAVFAGIYALIGAVLAYNVLYFGGNRAGQELYNAPREGQGQILILIGLGVLVLSILTAFYFTKRKAKRLGLKMWDNTAKKMFIHFMTPLVAGGLFCLIMLFKHNQELLIAPITLLFYGIALVNASSYSFRELRFLGYFQIVLGILSSLYLGYGIFFWAFGFGVLHIIYGFLMYKKHK